MTTADLMRLSLAQAGLDEQDLDVLRPSVLHYLNEGYAGLALRKLRPWTEETVMALEGRVPLEAFSRRPSQVIAAARAEWAEEGQAEFARGQALEAVLDENAACLRLSGSVSAPVTVRYRYLPRPLEHEADVPRLPAWAHGALADWAAYRLMMGGSPSRQQRGQAFRLAYEETLRQLTPFGKDVVQRKRFVGLY